MQLKWRTNTVPYVYKMQYMLIYVNIESEVEHMYHTCRTIWSGYNTVNPLAPVRYGTTNSDCDKGIIINYLPTDYSKAQHTHKPSHDNQPLRQWRIQADYQLTTRVSFRSKGLGGSTSTVFQSRRHR